MADHKKFIQRAIELGLENIQRGTGGPFGAVIVKNGKIIAEGWNTVTSSNDPTAHAEVNAIRKACAELADFQLKDCILYSSCEPCPMCLGAIYWARPEMLVFSSKREDAAAGGFDDEWLYQELNTPIHHRKIKTIHLDDPTAAELFASWNQKQDKIRY